MCERGAFKSSNLNKYNLPTVNFNSFYVPIKEFCSKVAPMPKFRPNFLVYYVNNLPYSDIYMQ